MAEDFSDQDSKAEAKAEEKAAPTWWEKKDMKMNGKKKMNGMSMMAIGPMIKTGYDAYWGTEEVSTLATKTGQNQRRKEKQKANKRKSFSRTS